MKISLLTALYLEASTTDGSSDDLGALINVLNIFGCIEARNPDVENLVYDVTVVADENVGMLGFNNYLWCIVAFGGAWDVVGTSLVSDTKTQS
jgi:hypothetical protein